MTPAGPCLGDALTALVDGELDHAARDRALAHLAGCDACRADVEDQRRLKARLAALPADAPSAELSSRLLALAVPGAEPPSRPNGPVRPVTVRSSRAPSGAPRPASGPGRRALRRITAVGGSVALVGLAAALVLGGGPTGGASAPIDPGADVFVVEHVSTTGDLPLREPVDAATVPAPVMSSRPRRVGTPRRVRTLGVLSCLALLVAGAPAVADARTSQREATALALLERAVRAARTVGYTGTQYVASWSAGTSTSTLADVAHDPSRGAAVTAATTNGAGAGPVVGAPSRLDRQVLAVLAQQYDLVVVGDAPCAGRTASVVEARRPGVDGAGAVAGRLWLDHDSGLLLRREVYDDAGRRVRSSAFLDVDITSGSAAGVSELARQPAKAVERAMRVPATAARGDVDSGLARLRRHGWPAPDQLPRGFVLFDVRLRDGAGGPHGEPAVAHLSYSDGLSTVSLFAQRGGLGGGPAGEFRQASMAGAPVWVHDATPSRVVWGGGGQVWTLVSDAPAEAVEATVLSLPHDAPAADGLLPRLARGLDRLGSALNPFS